MFDNILSAQVALVNITSDLTTPQTMIGPGVGSAPFVAGPTGAKVLSILATSTQASQMFVSVYILRNGISYFIFQVVIPASTGKAFDGSAVPNLLLNSISTPASPFVSLPTDSNGNPFILLGPGDSLQISALAVPDVLLTCYALITQ
jgi:hypothetical protein